MIDFIWLWLKCAYMPRTEVAGGWRLFDRWLLLQTTLWWGLWMGSCLFPVLVFTCCRCFSSSPESATHKWPQGLRMFLRKPQNTEIIPICKQVVLACIKLHRVCRYPQCSARRACLCRAASCWDTDVVLHPATHLLFSKVILEALIKAPWHETYPMEAKRFDPYGRICFALDFSILGLFFCWTFCTRGQRENKSWTQPNSWKRWASQY